MREGGGVGCAVLRKGAMATTLRVAPGVDPVIVLALCSEWDANRRGRIA